MKKFRRKTLAVAAAAALGAGVIGAATAPATASATGPEATFLVLAPQGGTVDRALAPRRSWSTMIAVVRPSRRSTSGRAWVGMNPCTNVL